jgi:hypothetical protein
MKIHHSALILLVCGTQSLRAELFASSTNAVQTLTIASGEAIIYSTFKVDQGMGAEATVVRSNVTGSLPFAPSPGMQALAGPMQIQYPTNNVIMEYQRLSTTNMFTVVFDTNGTTIFVPANKTINFLTPVSEAPANPPVSWSAVIQPGARMSLSNTAATVSCYLNGGETFTGPLTVTVQPGSKNNVNLSYSNGWVTYYFTEEFAQIPSLGATALPAGKTIVTVEKSQDLTNWTPVFFNTSAEDQRVFYRLKASK